MTTCIISEKYSGLCFSRKIAKHVRFVEKQGLIVLKCTPRHVIMNSVCRFDALLLNVLPGERGRIVRFYTGGSDIFTTVFYIGWVIRHTAGDFCRGIAFWEGRNVSP